eukprot:4620825-Karenia_brevis.AAC.1
MTTWQMHQNMWRDHAYSPPPYNYYNYHNHDFYPPSHIKYQGGGKKKSLVAWRCTHCKAEHHNPSKRACRMPNCPGVNPTLPIVAPTPYTAPTPH